jgi:hypothetical protein
MGTGLVLVGSGGQHDLVGCIKAAARLGPAVGLNG